MAAGEPGGVEEVRAALADAVRSRPDLVDDPERLNGYLRDMCPTRTAEVAVIVVAVRAGVRDELSRASRGHAVEALSARLAARLHTEFGIDEGLARWAVDSWAVAIGVLQPRVLAQPTPAAPDDALRAMAARVDPTPPDEVADGPATAVPPPAPMVEEPTRQPSPLDAAGRTVNRPQSPVATPPPVPQRSNPWLMRALVGGAALAACLAVVAVLALAGGDGGDGPGPASETAGPTTTAAAPTVTTAPPTTPAPTVTTAVPSPFPGGVAAIAPGAYRTTRLRPGITATVADGWKVTAEQQDLLELRSVEGDTQVFSVLRPVRPLWRASAFPTGEAIQQPGSVEAKPDDYVAWLRSHTRLSVSEPTPVVKGGFRGTQVDVTVRSAYSADYCGAPCVTLFQLDEGILFTLFEGSRNRVYVFTVGDSQILIVTEAPADRFQAFADRADRLVETIRFTG